MDALLARDQLSVKWLVRRQANKKLWIAVDLERDENGSD